MEIQADVEILPNSLSILQKEELEKMGLDSSQFGGPQVCFSADIRNNQKSLSNSFCEELGNKVAPNRLPVVWFWGKKNGDVVELTLYGKKSTLKCVFGEYWQGGRRSLERMVDEAIEGTSFSYWYKDQDDREKLQEECKKIKEKFPL